MGRTCRSAANGKQRLNEVPNDGDPNMTIEVVLLDSGREPQCKPEPKDPNGRDIEIAGAVRCCSNLPYPAPRCGVYEITCNDCGLKVALTVAGRIDDPRTITIPCKVKLAS